ncbi:MAG: stage III sporulation protein AA [Sporomusaceae bacterium]|nr:stage III sporulation protein AA [Sporomusaceae bacterium]
MEEMRWQTIWSFLVPRIRSACELLDQTFLFLLTEIRLRVGWAPLLVTSKDDEWLRDSSGNVLEPLSAEEIQQMLYVMSQHSLYAFSEQLKEGFITIHGGHRIGLAGQVVVREKTIAALTAISSLNIRLCREVLGCADAVMPYLFCPDHFLCNTLIISPPRCGKTTLLRDIARQLSCGLPELSQQGRQVGLVDERSEIAACRDGIPTVDLGPRLDVLDACPKAQGMLMLIRSMAPDVIITDELGRAEDAQAIAEAIHAGVALIASVHGRTVDEVRQRPYIGRLIEERYFSRYILLGNTPTPGTILQIVEAETGQALYPMRKSSFSDCS